MAIYFVFFVWILLFAVFPQLQKNKTARNLLFVCLGLFLCTGYMVGSDWRSYEYGYEHQTLMGDRTELEVGYRFVTYTLSRLGVEFWHFYILTKFFCYYVIIKFILKYTKGKFAWALLYFYSYLSLYYFIDCPFRNLIAASIFLYAMDSILMKDWKRFIILTLIASMFHMSVLLFAPFLFLLIRRDIIMNRRWFLYLAIGVYVLFAFLIQIDVLQNIQLFFEAVLGDMKNLDYLLEVGTNFSIGLVVITVFYLFIIFRADYSKISTKEVKLINCSLLYFLFYMIMYFIPMANRLSMFGFMPFICSIAICIDRLLVRKNKMIIVVLGIFVLFLGHSVMNTITRDYRYVPHSSYIEYIGIDKPSYDERANYNMVNSPYKDKTYEIQHRK